MLVSRVRRDPSDQQGTKEHQDLQVNLEILDKEGLLDLKGRTDHRDSLETRARQGSLVFLDPLVELEQPGRPDLRVKLVLLVTEVSRAAQVTTDLLDRLDHPVHLAIKGPQAL